MIEPQEFKIFFSPSSDAFTGSGGGRFRGDFYCNFNINRRAGSTWAIGLARSLLQN
jgi:hypothetical protein